MRTNVWDAKPEDWVVYNSYEGEIVAIFTERREAIDHARKQWFWSYMPYAYWDAEAVSA